MKKKLSVKKSKRKARPIKRKIVKKKIVKKIKKLKKVVKKSLPSTLPSTPTLSRSEMDKRALALVSRVRTRGFVTYSDLLKDFPNIERDIDFLDSLYQRFEEEGIDVLEEGDLLSVEPEEVVPAPRDTRHSRYADSAIDSVQMYLK